MAHSNNMNRIILFIAIVLSIMGCAPLPNKPGGDAASAAMHQHGHITVFSENSASGLPDQWTPLVILRTKKPTQYQLVEESGKTVLHAYAREASSGLMQYLDVNPLAQPWLNWEWKIGMVAGTDASKPQVVEDSPVRIILGFDGDKDSLPFADQILFETAKLITGHDFPYATLMYIWDKNAAVGTIMPSHRSGRIKMLVVANTAEGVGKWQSFNRNIATDFEAAFGEKPGQLIGVGVLTDTDNLGGISEAWYGDIRLRPERK